LSTVCATVAHSRAIENRTLFIVCAIILPIAIVTIRTMRVPGGVNAGTLGWMSEQWLAQHRASHIETG
jgi:hypothetical protein